jgi:arsenate reductase
MPPARLRVLFLCTGNSARSQMAEALARKLTGGKADVFSAGTEPRAEVHPLALDVLRRTFKIDASGQSPKPLTPFLTERFDYIISVCDRAAASCPVFPGDPERIRWSFPDPAEVEGTPDQRRYAFEKTGHELVTRIRLWLNLPNVRKALRDQEGGR